ncbi:5'/3'-nucleotidase SurE [Rubidibacter lacunae KORDI 51-2]|uniref:5'-nucleotidase SurE n=1 Tax=Rubidibacter lacunae KORDI 51-2 TaxID=582515 RepID=U5DMX2_9CHRO|nr:5'/3'-nucleotidase SurE [Rubidibacter lacunae]ERN42192.1 5'/3'-nucleotidase SurE [Rubidibacter lacunae KORDI 51-2]
MAHLLIGNDDGIFALGVRALADSLAAAGHTVTVVCPDRERSATGHGLTLHQPIRAQAIEGLFSPAVRAWSCSGTPSDCIKLALHALLDDRPDYVLSGINHGPNLGTDVLYSGTVSAAMEGAIEGITGIAFSLASFGSFDFSAAAAFAQSLVAPGGLPEFPEPTLLNINIPALPAAQIAGVTIARQGLRRYIEQFEQRVDPRGKHYYWLAGEAIEDIEQPDHLHLPDEVPTDVCAIRDRYITVVPLQFDLTAASSLIYLRALGGLSGPTAAAESPI